MLISMFFVIMCVSTARLLLEKDDEMVANLKVTTIMLIVVILFGVFFFFSRYFSQINDHIGLMFFFCGIVCSYALTVRTTEDEGLENTGAVEDIAWPLSLQMICQTFFAFVVSVHHKRDLVVRVVGSLFFMNWVMFH